MTAFAPSYYERQWIASLELSRTVSALRPWKYQRAFEVDSEAVAVQIVILNPGWTELEQHFPDSWPSEPEYQLWSLYDQRLYDGRNGSLSAQGIMPTDRQGAADSEAGGGSEYDSNRSAEELDFLASGGWSIARPKAEGTGLNGGLVGHLGVLQPEEYVDRFELRRQACLLLGFTYEQVRSVYGAGRIPKERQQLRAEVDREMLRLASLGGNMWQLASALMVDRNTIRRAIKRAKDSEESD